MIAVGIGIACLPIARKETSMNRLALALAVVLIPSTVSAQGTQQGHMAMLKWKLMDTCAKQAQTAYPENNAASNANRDTVLRACLSANGLPPRQPLSQPEPR
jgi:hypothetical protein